MTHRRFLSVVLALAVLGVTASSGSATPGVWAGSGPGTTTATGAGTIADPAIFTYNYFLGDPGPGATGSWTFSTEATGSGPVTLNWSYSGFHAYFNVTVGLQAFVTPNGGGSTTTTQLVSDGPANCCAPPSGGFSYSGTTIVNVNAGDTFGFKIDGHNFDSNSRLQGTLTVAGVQAPPTPKTVALLSAIPTAGGSIVTGLVSGTPGGAGITLHGGATCPAGAGVIGSASQTIPAEGSAYFTAFVTATTGKVSASADGGDESNCIPVGVNNTSWPNAALLSGSADGYISTPGESRWYKFRPGTDAQVTLALSNLAANFDLAFFKDIGQAFTNLTAPDALTKLSAEFAGDAYSPSQFSPSQFSPSQFSPSQFSPSQFSADAFSPSQFSPSQFSPSQFSPSQFSPSQFSPSQFSSDAFSPSQFSPSQFSPSQFSAEAFSSAQTRSLIAVSALDGTADESISANTWTNSGDVYVRVSGRNGAFSDSQAFHLTSSVAGGTCGASVAPIGSAPGAAAGGGYKTVILTDPARMTGTAAEKSALASQLTTLAARPEVAGVVVDLGANSRISSLNAQADANKSCPYAKNLLAGAIKDIVTSYRAANPLEYVVIVGADDVVPFFRYPDATLLGNEKGYVPPVLDTSASQASLRLGYVLGQDGYGSSSDVSIKGSTVPVPDLAVGRLVESPAEISGMLTAYLGTSGGVVPTPSSSLVTGYDFLTDAANAVKNELSAGGTIADTLITPANVSPLDPQSWTATQLRTKLLGSRHDLMFLAGHFSANSALAADFSTSMLTTELDASTVNLANSIVFSAGCHSGYNIVDRDGVPSVTVPLDWAEAFARKRATLIAGTGYQYGDTDFLEYSERLYLNFAKDLRAGTGPVAVGQALVDAKQQYLAGTQLLEGLHQKAVIEATLFGLPMLSVNLPQGRGGTADIGPSIVGPTNPALAGTPGGVLGLSTADVTLSPTLTPHTVTQQNVDGGAAVTATWLSGPDGIATSALAPTLPLDIVNVTVPGQVLRGIGFVGGSYTDSAVTPLTGTPTTEIRGVHSPFSSSAFYPARPWTINYFDALSGGGSTRLMLTPAQYRSTSIGSLTSTQRKYGSLTLRLFFSANTLTTGDGSTPALSAPPTIADVSADPATDGVDVRVHVVGNPAAGVQDTWITWSDASATSGNWSSLDLTQDPDDSTLWTAHLPFGGTLSNLRFFVQSVNGVGLVTLDDANGAYFRASAPEGAPPPQATELHLVSPPTAGVFGTKPTVAAVLSEGGAPLVGKLVTFAIGSQTAADTTDASGRAQASLPLLVKPGAYSLRATFGGTNADAPSSDENPITVTKQPTTLALTPTGGTVPIGVPAGIVATLKAGGAPLSERSVAIIVAGPGGPTAITSITDFLGRARFDDDTLAPGTYTVSAYFSGTIPFPGGAQTLVDPAYLASTDSTPLTVVVTHTSLCDLTKSWVHGSSKWATSSQAQRTVVNASLTALCATLAAIRPDKPVANKALIVVYKAGVLALKTTGYLTQSQATTLAAYADKLA